MDFSDFSRDFELPEDFDDSDPDEFAEGFSPLGDEDDGEDVSPADLLIDATELVRSYGKADIPPEAIILLADVQAFAVAAAESGGHDAVAFACLNERYWTLMGDLTNGS